MAVSTTFPGRFAMILTVKPVGLISAVSPLTAASCAASESEEPWARLPAALVIGASSGANSWTAVESELHWQDTCSKEGSPGTSPFTPSNVACVCGHVQGPLPTSKIPSPNHHHIPHTSHHCITITPGSLATLDRWGHGCEKLQTAR